MAVTTQLTKPQWRLMNLLHNYILMSGLRGDVAMERTGTDFEDVRALDRHGFVCARRGVTKVDSLAELPPHQFKRVDFRLTHAGEVWVQDNPLNVLLRSLDMVRNRRMRLDEAVAWSDKDTVRKATEIGFATLHYAGDQREVGDSVCGPYEFNNARDYTLNLTPKARHVLGE